MSIKGKFTTSAQKMAIHMAQKSGVSLSVVAGTMATSTNLRSKPVILLDEEQSLKVGSRANIVLHAGISQATVDALGLKEGADVEVQLDTKKYNPAMGAQVQYIRSDESAEWTPNL